MSNTYCSVPNCTSWRKKNTSISFFSFPKPGFYKVHIENKFGEKELIDRLKAWILKLRIGKKVTKHMKVCSLHFKEEDFFNKGDSHKRIILKRNSVPSQNLPLQNNELPIKTRHMINIRNQIQFPCASTSCTETAEDCTTDADLPLNEIEAANTLLELLNSKSNATERVSFRDFSVQVNTPKQVTLCDFLETDEALNTCTGLKDHVLLNTILKVVELHYKVVRVHRLSLKDKIILTFTKLKCDLSYVMLAILFRISNNVCRQYVSEMLTVLSTVLRPVITFPTSSEIFRNMPKCFEDFQNVRIVLDCTEIYVQRPKCLCCRIRFYSHYKSNLTVKCMVGVSPAGLITYVSKAYGGRASDKQIFEQSGLISMLEENKDCIMVDKGFLIDNICSEYNIKLIRPPFVRQKKQLSSKEATTNVKIAAARVHVERCNQRLKIFKILSGKLPWCLVKHVEHIIVIICAVTNLSSPILAEDKFLKE